MNGVRPRCLVFNPFFPVLGGGERYTVDLGHVIEETHDVTYASPHGLDPQRVDEIGFPWVDVIPLRSDEFAAASVDYDLAVVVSLDIPPATFAGRSVQVLQFPREGFSDASWLRRVWIRRRIRKYHSIVNSEFAREWTRRRWGVRSRVVYPPVGLAQGPPEPKENLVLAIGRFLAHEDDLWNSKRHDALIDAFAQLRPELRESWHLVLAGVAPPSAAMDKALDDLRQRASGLNVTLEPNTSAERLDDLLAHARLFWHASGYERPPDEPEQAEHFGMVTVEAMSHGAIPLVFADGGQLEIVTAAWGRLWTTLPELVEQTEALMTAPPDELDALGDAARAASQRFGRPQFERAVRDFLLDIGARTRRAPALASAWRRFRFGASRVAGGVYRSIFRA